MVWYDCPLLVEVVVRVFDMVNAKVVEAAYAEHVEEKNAT